MSHANHSSRPLHLNDLLGLLPWIPAGPVCDIGSGEGHLAAALAAYGFAVEALDVDQERLQQVASAYGERVSWVHHDVRGYRLQRESYAAIFCLDVFPFIPNGERARIIGRLKAAVKPGGLLVISGLNERDAAADCKWARSSNQISQLPTGVFQPLELEERLQDWEVLFSFEGRSLHELQAEKVSHELSQIVARKPLASPEATDWRSLPHLGVGMSWQEGAAETLSHKVRLDFIEVSAEHYLEPYRDPALSRLCREFTVLPRAQELSLGSPELRQDGYLEALARVVGRCHPPWWSEHLAYTRSELHESLQLNPLPPTEESLETVKRNLRQVRKQIPVPVLLRNIAYAQPFAAGEMDDATFLRHVAVEADCGILLDLGQLWSNAVNIKQDPYLYLKRLPAERVIQLHIASHQYGGPVQPAGKEIWSLVEAVLRYCDVRAICLDGEAALAAPEAFLKDMERARKLLGVRL